jgi:hypothetical protein
MFYQALLHRQAWLYFLDLQPFSEVRPSAFVWTQLFSLLIVGLLTALVNTKSTTAEIWEKIEFYLDNKTPKKLTAKRIDRQLKTILENVRENKTLPECDREASVKRIRATLKELIARRQDLSDRQKNASLTKLRKLGTIF